MSRNELKSSKTELRSQTHCWGDQIFLHGSCGQCTEFVSHLFYSFTSDSFLANEDFFFFKSRVICSLESILDKAMFKLPLLDTRLPAHLSPLPSPAWCCGWTNGQPWASLNPGTRDICDNMMGSEAREDYHLLTTLLAVSVYFITLTLSDFSKPRQRTVGKL